MLVAGRAPGGFCCGEGSEGEVREGARGEKSSLCLPGCARLCSNEPGQLALTNQEVSAPAFATAGSCSHPREVRRRRRRSGGGFI